MSGTNSATSDSTVIDALITHIRNVITTSDGVDEEMAGYIEGLLGEGDPSPHSAFQQLIKEEIYSVLELLDQSDLTAAIWAIQSEINSQRLGARRNQ